MDEPERDPQGRRGPARGRTRSGRQGAAASPSAELGVPGAGPPRTKLVSIHCVPGAHPLPAHRPLLRSLGGSSRDGGANSRLSDKHPLPTHPHPTPRADGYLRTHSLCVQGACLGSWAPLHRPCHPLPSSSLPAPPDVGRSPASGSPHPPSHSLGRPGLHPEAEAWVLSASPACFPASRC